MPVLTITVSIFFAGALAALVVMDLTSRRLPQCDHTSADPIGPYRYYVSQAKIQNFDNAGRMRPISADVIEDLVRDQLAKVAELPTVRDYAGPMRARTLTAYEL